MTYCLQIATSLVAYTCKTGSASQRCKPLLSQFPKCDGNYKNDKNRLTRLHKNTNIVTLIHICGARWFSTYVSAKVSGAATSQSRLGQNSQRLGLGDMRLGSRLGGLGLKGLVHIRTKKMNSVPLILHVDETLKEISFYTRHVSRTSLILAKIKQLRKSSKLQKCQPNADALCGRPCTTIILTFDHFN